MVAGHESGGHAKARQELAAPRKALAAAGAELVAAQVACTRRGCAQNERGGEQLSGSTRWGEAAADDAQQQQQRASPAALSQLS